MTPPELAAILKDGHPGAFGLLSPLGHRAAMPMGIPQQSDQAKGVLRNATIGQITDGAGRPLLLPSLAERFVGFPDTTALLYASTAGFFPLREAWLAHLALPPGTPTSLPVVAVGITHALALAADLFTTERTPVLVGAPYWGNYEQVFTMRTGAPLRPFPFFGPDGRYNLPALTAALAALDGPAAVILNFPSNPTGYTPYPDEAAALVRLLAAHPHPLCVVCDDAYSGLTYDPALDPKSLYGVLANALDPSRSIVCKCDGATKELVFFGGRVGFLTMSAGGAAGEALAEKAATILRGTVSSVAKPPQVAVHGSLTSPNFEAERGAVLAVLRERRNVLKTELDRAQIPYWPFNSGCFALVRAPEHLRADDLRMRLIREESVGVISVPSVNGLRIAFCSVEATEIPDLVARLVRVFG
jgi:aspartate/methionine/tyrosine aminotransferase